jgi:uncharacterized protein YciI
MLLCNRKDIKKGTIKMSFLIPGYDGKDEQALERRLAARPDHIRLGDQLRDQGKVRYGVAMLDDDNKMIGSVYVMNMDTREELDQYLAIEPYVTGNVWQKIDIMPYNE